MLKKWIYIFTAFCLINTIDGDGTLLDFLIQSFQDDSSDNDNKTPLKLKCRHAHFYSRSASLSIQTPIQDVYTAVYLPRPARIQYGNYQVRKATLPSYYNFLFRLNPF